jgi:hypothetical protein
MGGFLVNAELEARTDLWVVSRKVYWLPSYCVVFCHKMNKREFRSFELFTKHSFSITSPGGGVG